MIVVISGPGGVGKGTVVSRLIERDDHLWLSRSWTTRQRRPGESPDAYVFVSPEAFQRQIDENGFLEWVEFLDYRQGTPIPPTSLAGKDAVFEIDVNGAQAIADRYPAAVLLFIDAPSVEEQRSRLIGRGDSAERVEQRIQTGHYEREHAQRLGATIVINDDLDATVEQILDLLNQQRYQEKPV